MTNNQIAEVYYFDPAVDQTGFDSFKCEMKFLTRRYY